METVSQSFLIELTENQILIRDTIRDFAQEKILLVERNKDGSLKRKVFANKFRERVDAMLNQ